MRKTNKRGFTIVELVIVIAVIAILAAVLIPTFTNLVKKANQSADTQLVRNLNTALTVENQDYPTMHDALEVVKEAGYDVAKIAASDKDNTILWDSVNQCFVYMKKGATEPEYIPNTKEKDAQPYQLWKIYTDKTEAEASTYSVYWNGGDLDEITVTDVGFDAGNATVASVKYTGTAANSVVIRTNSASTSLEVDAPAATVYHYGATGDVNIIAVASASYHENGRITGKATISQGHFAIEAGASVPQVLVANVAEGKTVKVTANEGTVITVAENSSAKTTVVANVEEVYVSGAGTIEGTQKDTVVIAQSISSTETLKAALMAGGFYNISDAFNLTELVNVPENKKVVIDLAGKKITYADNWLWTIDGELTIVDSVGTGEISCGKGAFENHGVLVINGGTINADTRSGSTIASGYDFTDVYPDAKLVINNVTINTINNHAVFNYAYFELNGGELNSTSSSEYGDNNWGYCVANYGSYSNFVANGGKVTGIQGAIAISGGNATINNVWAETEKDNPYSSYAIYVAGETAVSSCNIYGGTFIGGYRNAAQIGNKADGGEGKLATATIYGGTFIGADRSPAIKITDNSSTNYGIGYATIYGGTFSTDVSGANGVETVTVDAETGYYVVNKK